MLALMPCEIATLATDAPGPSHSANTCTLYSRLSRRREAGFSLPILSTYFLTWTRSSTGIRAVSRRVYRALTVEQIRAEALMHLPDELRLNVGLVLIASKESKEIGN